MEINHLVKTIVKDFTNTLFEKDLSYPFQIMPWELTHRPNMPESLVLARTTTFPLPVHLDFTPEKQEIILRAVLESNKPSTCAKLAKIDPGMLEKWLKMGERGISPYRNFYLEFSQAEAIAQARDVRVLRDGGWKGAEVLLKLRWGWQESLPEKYALRQQMKDLDKSNEGNNSTNINITNETNINIKPLAEMKDEEKKLELFKLLDEANRSGNIIDHD